MSDLTPDLAADPAQTPPPAPRAPRFKAPDTTLIIFSIILLAAVLTWVIPPGAFERSEIEVEGAGTREVVVPGTFQTLERETTGVWPRLVHTVAIVFQAPIRGFADPAVADIIAFVLFIGGMFSILAATGAIDAGLKRTVLAAERSPRLERALIPLFMGLFSLAGAVFGMAEETIPFVLIFVPLALALGYDSLTGAAIPFLGSAAGFAAAFFNPFTVGVAQGIAGVPLFSGAGFRLVLWVFTTGAVTAFVMWHAARVKRDPTKSPVFALDQTKRADATPLRERDVPFTGRHKAVLVTFGLSLLVLVWGVFPREREIEGLGTIRGLSYYLGGEGWYIIEIAAFFVGLGVLLAVLGGLGANRAAQAFMEGVKDLAPTAAIIGIARGILVVLEDGQAIDPILHALASGLEGTGSTVSAMAMFGAQTVINFFVPSGSGQAALTMPLMAPLADLVGVSRQTAVLSFQMGDGFTNMIIPTSAVLMGVLSLARIPWPTWARWVFPLQALLFVLGLAALAVATAVGFA
ncbi:MAG TPA: putative basic amino acid antiporter YfcC [Bacteroidetes bacterium]|nr:putative basic amino acid antiporter YfcC [Bacteroidota bacterium]